MQETKVISPDYIDKASAIDAIINNFETSGEPFGDKGRNSLKLFELDKSEDMFFTYMNYGIQGLLNYVIERSSFDYNDQDFFY